MSHKPGGRLPLLSTRPAVTPASLERAAANFAAWWTEPQCCEQFAYDCYLTMSRLRFQPRRFCAWVQQANDLAINRSRCMPLTVLLQYLHLYWVLLWLHLLVYQLVRFLWCQYGSVAIQNRHFCCFTYKTYVNGYYRLQVDDQSPRRSLTLLTTTCRTSGQQPVFSSSSITVSEDVVVQGSKMSE